MLVTQDAIYLVKTTKIITDCDDDPFRLTALNITDINIIYIYKLYIYITSLIGVDMQSVTATFEIITCKNTNMSYNTLSDCLFPAVCNLQTCFRELSTTKLVERTCIPPLISSWWSAASINAS